MFRHSLLCLGSSNKELHEVVLSVLKKRAWAIETPPTFSLPHICSVTVWSVCGCLITRIWEVLDIFGRGRPHAETRIRKFGNIPALPASVEIRLLWWLQLHGSTVPNHWNTLWGELGLDGLVHVHVTVQAFSFQSTAARGFWERRCSYLS